MLLKENLDYLATIGYPVLNKSYVGLNWLISVKLKDNGNNPEKIFTKRGLDINIITQQVTDEIKVFLLK